MKTIDVIFALIFVLTFAVTLKAQAQSTPPMKENTSMYRIQIILGEHVITASLDDTPSTRDLVKQLPLTLELKDYAATEKIAYPPKKLTIQGTPVNTNPGSEGDIAYYAPWGNLAIFYKDFRYSQELIRLGHITSGLEHLKYSGTKQATIKLISND